MNICAVVFRKSEGRLELAREVCLAVDRLDRVIGRGRHLGRTGRRQGLDLFTVKPDFPVARGPGRGVGGPAAGVVLKLVSECIVNRRGAAQDVALHVAAGCQGREQRLVDLSNRRGQVALQDAVELELLAGRDPHRAVAERPGQLVARQELIGRQLPAHNPHPHHQLVGFLLLFALQPGAQVAVVLLVGAVELEDGRGVVAEMVQAVVDLLGHERLQVLAGDLHCLDLARLGAIRGSGRLHRHPLSLRRAIR